MTSELGVWTADDCALVLIDYQTEMVEVIRSETNSDLVELHARLLAKTAKAFDVPIVLSTVGVGYGFNGPTVSSLLAELDGIEPIDRTSINAFEDAAFRAAVEATGRKRLIIGGIRQEVVPRVRNGRGTEGPATRWMFVTDAVGGHSQVAHRTSIERLWRQPGRCRPPRSQWSPSSSTTGPVRCTSRLSTSSTGTSAKSRCTPIQVGVADKEKSHAAEHQAAACRDRDVSQHGP